VSAGYYKQCNPSEDNANIYCWSVDKNAIHLPVASKIKRKVIALVLVAMVH